MDISLDSWCWIMNTIDGCPYFVGTMEQFFLWYIPGIVVLFISSLLMTIIMAILACKLYQKKINSSAKEALTQMLPLTAYPITFFVLILFPFTNRVYEAAIRSSNYGLLVIASFCIPAYSLAAGLALMMHVCLMTRSNYRIVIKYGTIDQEGAVTAKIDSMSSNTKWNPRNESDVDAKLLKK